MSRSETPDFGLDASYNIPHVHDDDYEDDSQHHVVVDVNINLDDDESDDEHDHSIILHPYLNGRDSFDSYSSGHTTIPDDNTVSPDGSWHSHGSLHLSDLQGGKKKTNKKNKSNKKKKTNKKKTTTKHKKITKKKSTIKHKKTTKKKKTNKKKK